MTAVSYAQLSPQKRRRLARRSLLRSLLVSVVIIAGYFLLPMTHLGGDLSVALAGGLAVVALLLAWQIRDITRSPYPRIRAIGTLATSLPLFLAIFATTYFLLGRNDPANFSQSLSKLDSAYFTVTVFSTVGFGDIVPVSEIARIVTIVQMFGDLLIVGLVARVLFSAVQQNLSQRED